MLSHSQIIEKVSYLENKIREAYPDIKFIETRTLLFNSCPWCKSGQLRTIYGKYGYFVGCSNYPNCRYTKNI